MKILTVLRADRRRDARQAKDGEPCVPSFSVCGKNLFTGLETDGLASTATPGEVSDAVLDGLWEKLRERYKHVPEKMLENQVFASASAATELAPGAVVRSENLESGRVRLYTLEPPGETEADLE
jgi:hypothetical protein